MRPAERSALVAGFRAASGAYVITIDSDSEVEPRTVHETVTPFLVDPKGDLVRVARERGRASCRPEASSVARATATASRAFVDEPRGRVRAG